MSNCYGPITCFVYMLFLLTRGGACFQNKSVGCPTLTAQRHGLSGKGGAKTLRPLPPSCPSNSKTTNQTELLHTTSWLPPKCAKFVLFDTCHILFTSIIFRIIWLTGLSQLPVDTCSCLLQIPARSHHTTKTGREVNPDVESAICNWSQNQITVQ